MRLYSFKKELLFSLEFPVLHMTAVFLVHKADDEDHIWSCEIHFGSTVEQDSKFFTFRVAEFHNIEIINLYEILTFLWTLNCNSTTAVVKDTFFRKSRVKFLDLRLRLLWPARRVQNDGSYFKYPYNKIKKWSTFKFKKLTENWK